MAYDAVKAEEARRAQVSEQMERLERAVAELDSTVQRVEDRLGPVLRVADADKNKAVAGEDLVPLAGSMHMLTVRVKRQSERLNDMLARLEL